MQRLVLLHVTRGTSADAGGLVFVSLFSVTLESQSVLEDVTSRPESFSGEVLLRTRRRLGVSEVVAGGMHLDIYQSAIQVADFCYAGAAACCLWQSVPIEWRRPRVVSRLVIGGGGCF